MPWPKSRKSHHRTALVIWQRLPFSFSPFPSAPERFNISLSPISAQYKRSLCGGDSVLGGKCQMFINSVIRAPLKDFEWFPDFVITRPRPKARGRVLNPARFVFIIFIIIIFSRRRKSALLRRWLVASRQYCTLIARESALLRRWLVRALYAKYVSVRLWKSLKAN